MTINERVIKLICNQCSNKEEAANKIANNMKSDLQGDLGLDSLDSVELIMGMEAEFNLEISDEKANLIKTVEDAIKFVEENIAK